MGEVGDVGDVGEVGGGSATVMRMAFETLWSGFATANVKVPAMGLVTVHVKRLELTTEMVPGSPLLTMGVSWAWNLLPVTVITWGLALATRLGE